MRYYAFRRKNSPHLVILEAPSYKEARERAKKERLGQVIIIMDDDLVKECATAWGSSEIRYISGEHVQYPQAP